MWVKVMFMLFVSTQLFSSPDQTIASSAVRVDAREEVGPLPHLYRTGLFALWGSPPEYVQERLFRDHRLGTIEVDIGALVTHPSSSFDDLRRRLNELDPLDSFLQRVEKAGGEAVIAITGMPRWLSANPTAMQPIFPGESIPVAQASPPRDYTIWAQVVSAIVDHFNNQVGLKAWYKLWWEPDAKYWQGTEREFFELYKYTVVGARTADKTAKVGGPSVSNWTGAHWKDGKGPMTYNFIQYCASTPIPELGLSRVPIDFLVWHQFNSEPSRGFVKPAAEIKGWLRHFGFEETIPLLIGEWSTWKEWGAPTMLSSERDTEYTASYVIAAIIGMERAGITHHAFTSSLEQQPQKYQGEFGGDFGIFTKSLIIKPVYNAFRTLSYLGEKQLKVEITDPFLAGVATRGQEGVTLLLANFVPDGRMLRQAIGLLLQERGYTRKDLADYGLTREKLEPLVKEFKQKGKVNAQAHGLPRRVQTDLNDVAAFAQQVFTRNKESVVVDVHFQHLPADFVRYERYLIDATHSNSYAVRDRLGASVERAKREARGQAEQLLLQRGRSRQEIERLKGLLARGELQRLRGRADPDTRAAYTHYVQSNTAAIDAINEWPEVKLQKVEDKNIGSTGEYRETLSISPYSVTLIRLSR